MTQPKIRGLVDVIVPENFGENYRLKMQADYAEFIGLTQGTSCRLLAPLNSMSFFRPPARRALVHAAGRGLQPVGPRRRWAVRFRVVPLVAVRGVLLRKTRGLLFSSPLSQLARFRPQREFCRARARRTR